MNLKQNVSEDYLAPLIAEFADDSIHAAALTGSFARGEADEFSDIDLLLFRGQPLDVDQPHERLIDRDGRLISLTTATCKFWRDHFGWPSMAVYTVPAFRNLKIIFDHSGELAGLQQMAHAFSWEPLEDAANRFVTERVTQQAEVVHKLLSGLVRNDPEQLAMYTWELVTELSLTVAVYHRLFIPSSNQTFQAVCAAGESSVWTANHRLASGVAPQTNGTDPLVFRALAALDLYATSVSQFEALLSPDQRAVCAATLTSLRRLPQVSG